jgi:hypothetical protein
VTERGCAEAALERTGVLGLFAAVVTSDDVDCGKDRPDIFLRAAADLGTAPAETLVFEDALHALRTAKAAGFPTVGVYDAASEGGAGLAPARGPVLYQGFHGLRRVCGRGPGIINEPGKGAFRAGRRGTGFWIFRQAHPRGGARPDAHPDKARLRFAGSGGPGAPPSVAHIKSMLKGEKMKTALTIAGSDSSGGAGIQADLKTMTMNGVFAMSAVTALTAQNTTGVTGDIGGTPEFLASSSTRVSRDIFPDAVKIGMVSSRRLIEVIADRLRRYGAERISWWTR